MDFAAFKEQLLAHYVAMAELPWAKAQAWHSVNALAQAHPAQFGDLPAELIAEMKRRTSNENDPHPHD